MKNIMVFSLIILLLFFIMKLNIESFRLPQIRKISGYSFIREFESIDFKLLREDIKNNISEYKKLNL